MVVKIKKNIKVVCYINFLVIDLFFKLYVFFDFGVVCFVLLSFMIFWYIYFLDICSLGGSCCMECWECMVFFFFSCF